MSNQCDGCNAGVPVDKHGIHRMDYPSGPIVCTKGRYDTYTEGDEEFCSYCDCRIPPDPLSRPCHNCEGLSDWVSEQEESMP